jgi:hypothetical protein
MILQEASLDMVTPASQPVIPPQPNLEVYGFQALALFQNYTRDNYRTTFGVEAPLWDPSRLKKTWFDTTVDPSNAATYKIVATDQAGQWTVQQLVISAQEAATVNLPGAVTYPPYLVAPSMAARAGSTIDPIHMSLEADARALMATIGGGGLLDEGMAPVWDILFKGSPMNAGVLLFNRNANGVGSPGRWDTSGSDPIWVPAPPAPTGLDDTRTPRPMPVRDLLPNEKIQTGLMGASIVRIDLQQQSDAASGQFTPDDRATLQQIYRIVSRLS